MLGKRLPVYVLLFAGLLASAQCSAGVIIDGSPVLDSQKLLPKTTATAIRSRADAAVPLAPSTSRAITAPRAVTAYERLTFAEAVRLIVPADWKGFAVDKRIGRVANLTWTPMGQPWPAELESVLRGSGITAALDWTRKEVEFRMPDASASNRIEPHRSRR
jgi:hypothetical protein